MLLLYDMKATKVEEVDGVFVYEFDRFKDARGYFEEIFRETRYLLPCRQINISRSAKNVIRGMHVVPFAKLCTCIRGSLWDVVADVREDSPTFGKWFGVWLTEENCTQLYIPPGCAHGFFASENDTLLCYLQDATYNPGVEREINWRDPTLNIQWPTPGFIPDSFPNPPCLTPGEYIISDKDQRAGFLK